MAEDQDKPRLLELFFVFAKIGGLTIGGGYVMLPVMQHEVVEKRGWITAHELTDYYALGQSVPGIIATNSAALIGMNKRGGVGAVVAVAGMTMPSIVVIVCIAAFLTPFMDLSLMQRAFSGVRAAVVAMMGVAVWKLGRLAIKGPGTALVAIVAFLLVAVLAVSPVVVLICGALAGPLLYRPGGSK